MCSGAPTRTLSEAVRRRRVVRWYGSRMEAFDWGVLSATLVKLFLLSRSCHKFAGRWELPLILDVPQSFRVPDMCRAGSRFVLRRVVRPPIGTHSAPQFRSLSRDFFIGLFCHVFMTNHVVGRSLVWCTNTVALRRSSTLSVHPFELDFS